jgi:hypothetical protein
MLDPFTIAGSDREPLEITPWVAAAGPNWGDADIAAYMSDMTIGSSPVTYRIPNRQISIPLILRDIGSTTFKQIRALLQQKVGLFQREQGWIMRQVDSTALYADVVNATLHLGGAWLQAYAGADIDAVLSLEVLPEWYGDEATLDTITGTGLILGKLKLSSADAIVPGDHGGRVRIAVSDTSANDQHGLIWGFRSRHYDSAATAALKLEGEALTALDAAATFSHSGASGGSTMRHNSLPGGSWCPVLSTDISGTGALTHVGSYRAWARVYSATATPQLRLVWDVGDLSFPETNDPTQVPAAANFYLVDLGQVNISPSPVGTHRWRGVIQALAAVQGDPIEIDVLYLQPLDETPGRIAATQSDSPLGISVADYAGTAADDAGVGTYAWSNPSYATGSYDNNYATANAGVSATSISHYLKLTNFGFAIPTGATISGFKVTVTRFMTRGTLGTGIVVDSSVKPVKAGTITSTNKADAVTPWPSSGLSTKDYGGQTDLWSGTWLPADINNTGFGVAISVSETNVPAAFIGAVQITVYYTTSGGFTTTSDAVIFASQTCELRTDGTWREDSAGVAYGPTAPPIGTLPRIPCAGAEMRPTELFIKNSRGNLDDEADAALDGMSAVITYRPTYLYTPDSAA